MFSSVLPPKGLIRHAQAGDVLGKSARDEEDMQTELSENKELESMAKKMDKEEEERKALFRQMREQMKKKREAEAKA